VAGIDFHENHAAIVHDITLHLILVMKIRYGLTSRQFDVETAFLYGTLEEEIIYMDFPEGYTEYML
jgi:hypothetical protein